MEVRGTEGRKLARELFGLFLLFWGLLVLLSLLTYDQGDPSLNHVVSSSAAVHNGAGLFGAYLAGLLVDVFGFAAFVWPLFFLAWGAGCVSTLITLPWWRWVGFGLLATCLLSLGTAWHLGLGDVRGGGMLGRLLHAYGTQLFSPAGSTLIWLFFLFISLELSFGIPWLDLMQRGWSFSRTKAREHNINWDTLRKSLPKPSLARLPRPRMPLPRLSTMRHKDTPQADPLIIDLDVILDPAPQAAATTVQTEPSVVPVRHNPAGAPAPPEDADADAVNAAGADTGPELDPLLRGVIFHGIAGDMPQSGPDDANEADDAGFAFDDEPDAASHDLLHDVTQAMPVAAVLADVLHASIPSISIAATFSAAEQARPVAPAAPIIQAAPVPVQEGVQPHPRAGKRARLPMPGVNLLSMPEKVEGAPPSREVLMTKGSRLMACLADFGIQCELAGITPGPVVSMFEIRPAPGVKVSRIVGLSDDLALALKAMAVRIQAPIPGSDTVGVEIPNEVRATVNFRELLLDATYTGSVAPLSMALGKDIGGHPFTTDLSRMPHMLVAGATGAGKSVCLNSILLSFLYKCTPEDVRFLLIDPKRIELAVYADLPHLVHPVVTEMTMAKTALEWAVHEMETRYDAMARMGVRNLAGFNTKLHEFGDKVPQGFEDLRPLPFLVIIIDELSDLMMTAGKDIETHIVRLAQLARAAGIHLIVATQRPSVDVVTGLIKANFPCRISFQVSSKHDSRTILDTVGAEHLLGKGDMLFKPSGGKLQRLHGAFVSDEEVVAVVEYWKKQQAPTYAVDFSDWGTEPEGPGPSGGGMDAEEGEAGLYAEVIAFVRDQGKVSISLIQRRFRIGFNKAARFVEQMEQDGIILPGDRQNKARQVNRGDGS